MTSNVFCEVCLQKNDMPNIVVGRGNPAARLMIIGEAPGAKEDLMCEPFVGRSGKLLDRLLEDVGINSHTDTYMCNVVKCRPPNNRRPLRKEILSSIPWLYKQIDLVDPIVIALIGATAVESILGASVKMTDARGIWQSWEGRHVMPLFHPSYLLRNPSKDKGSPLSLTQNDLIEIRKRINMSKIDPDMPILVNESKPGKLL